MFGPVGGGLAPPSRPAFAIPGGARVAMASTRAW